MPRTRARDHSIAPSVRSPKTSPCAACPSPTSAPTRTPWSSRSGCAADGWPARCARSPHGRAMTPGRCPRRGGIWTSGAGRCSSALGCAGGAARPTGCGWKRCPSPGTARGSPLRAAQATRAPHRRPVEHAAQAAPPRWGPVAGRQGRLTDRRHSGRSSSGTSTPRRPPSCSTAGARRPAAPDSPRSSPSPRPSASSATASSPPSASG